LGTSYTRPETLFIIPFLFPKAIIKTDWLSQFRKGVLRKSVMATSDRPLHLFNHPIQASFVRRLNRFLIKCKWNGKTIDAFLPNPGRLQELLLPGSVILLVEESEWKGRKTRCTAVAVERAGHPIMLHTHRTNEVARYLLREGKIPGLEKAQVVRSEVRVGRSRFDFLLRERDQEILLEVKSCTLVGERVAMFPDAVTERGARHLRELAELSEKGVRTAVLFIVHWPFAKVFMPDYHTDLNFSRTLLQVRDRVQVIPVSVRWKEDLSFSPVVKLLKIPWNYIEEEAKDQGSYLLILNLRKRQKIHVGALGRVSFGKGFYIYVGSAMANLSKRMERHKGLRKRHRWHIDELRAVAEIHSVSAIRSSVRLECEIAEALSEISEWTIPEFGSSDCSCETHLFGFERDPFHSRAFHNLLQYFRMDRFHGVTP
jgi:sugar fermentation stimulation protein A